MRKATLILVISAAGLQGNKKESAALSRVMKFEEKLPGMMKTKDSNSVTAEIDAVTGGTLDLMGLESLNCYK